MIEIIKEKKDMTNMSFVGIHHTADGLIAFADSKATRIYNDGRVEEDVNRNIKKLFYNEKFICVSHGNNELFDREAKITLEQYVEENLKDFIGYKEFFDIFFLN